jgi:hypothetical protein
MTGVTERRRQSVNLPSHYSTEEAVVKRDDLIRAAVFFALVAIAVTVRLVSETPNFNAITAAALFAGFYFRNRLTALSVPLMTMVVSDYFLGGYSKPMMLAVYASLCVPIAWRAVLQRGLNPLTVGGGAVCSSLAAFALSNFAVWYAWYPQTWEGFTRCYLNAVPFLANALTSDLLFSAGFFGLYAIAMQFCSEPATAKLADAA